MRKAEPSTRLSRRELLARAGLAGACLAAGPLRALAGDEAVAKRPNLIFLLTDDQRWDMMGCAGNPIIQTPQMDRLARDGVRFLNAFVTTAICAASRATLFTGLYERTHRYTFGTPPMRADHVDLSYPVRLRAAGYRTGFIGKFGVGVQRGGAAKMFDVFKPLSPPYLKKQPDGSERHLTDITGDEAVAFLRTCPAGQPFCLSVSFNAPHAEDNNPKQYIWPKAVDGLYRDVTIPLPDGEALFEKQPDFLKKSMNRIRWRWRFDSPEKAEEMTKGYYRMISGVDAAIGRLRDELERLGLAGDTAIVLMGDNGYFVGERGFAGKWLIYEESIRVPLIVYDPRAARRGLTPEPMALNVDIAPTLLDLAGVPVPEAVQGRSLVPLLRGETPEWRTDFFYEHLFENKTIPKSEGVRGQRWVYVRYFEQQPVYEELYDLQTDPHEERNLAPDPAHQATLDAMRTRCDELRDRYGGPFKPWTRKPQ